ncbi:FecR family protein [Fodinibius roseus]|uniref:FecR family protein n=1 Tax=Fodinibius roseus TaxID=1194090 RepID=A0A1M5BL63_9BACT|nr:FecR domain-containing protein [Fodinibius roseus]SHF43219.1 FecR family protein [Fodinibius roseus]
MKKANYSVDELIENESFRRWVRGSASEQEKSYWDKWVAGDSKNRRSAIRAQQKITGLSIQPSSQPDQQEAWDRLQKKMVGGRDSAHAVNRSGRSRNTGLQWIYRAAAVFLLVALTGLAVRFFADSQPDPNQTGEMVRNEVVTDYGERKTISLSDGSEIMLNAHSSLVYTMDPSDPNAVEVFLDGEAHFSVAKREQATSAAFRVKTSSGTVKVMGTQFVVSTRNRDTRVVLEEGEVALVPANQQKETIMQPGQLAEFSAGSDPIHTKFVNPEVYTSWTTYTLVFDKTPLSDVIARLENTYGVKVVVRDTDLYERKISGSVDNTSLDVITSALSNTLDTPIEVTDRAVYIGKQYSNRDFEH